MKGLYGARCFRRKRTKESQLKKADLFCILVVARLSSYAKVQQVWPIAVAVCGSSCHRFARRSPLVQPRSVQASPKSGKIGRKHPSRDAIFWPKISGPQKGPA